MTHLEWQPCVQSACSPRDLSVRLQLALQSGAVWADARDAPAQQRLLIQEDDAASVASDASTVVHEHPSADDLAAVEEQLAAEQPLQGEPPRRWSMRSEQAAEPAELPDAGAGAGGAASGVGCDGVLLSAPPA